MEILHWKVVAVIRETGDANTYFLHEATNRPVHYEAGQFLTFLINYRGREIRRSYSISSAPGVDQHVAITVKRKVNGELSRYIHENWHEGTIVTSLLPAGMFRIGPSSASRHFCFIAAGSGIVPVFSLLKKVLFGEPQSRVTLIYQNYDENHIIFDEQLLQLQQRFGPRFHRLDLLSRPMGNRHHPHRLNNALLERLIRLNVVPGGGDEHLFFYTCGPLLFMKMVEFTVRVMGFSADRIRRENFTVETPPAPALSIDPAPHQVTVRYGGQTYQFTTAFPVTILQAALNHQVSLPFSCRAGRCSSCVARCISGSIQMSVNDVLTEKDLQEGLVLTCVGYAETDVVLQF